MQSLNSTFESSCLYKLADLLKSYKKIYIYGAGRIGKFIFNYLAEDHLQDKIEAFIVSDLSTIKVDEICGKKILQIDQITINADDVVLLAVIDKYRSEILEICKKHHIKNIVEIDYFDKQRYKNLPESEYPTALTHWYQMMTGKKLDLKHPKTFNEKIQWLKIFDRNPLKTQLVDKYAVKDWVKSKIGEEYVVPLLGVYDKFDEIDFDKLPDKFVLKANHISGGVGIFQVKDKSKFDIAKARKRFEEIMQMRIGINDLRLQYHDIKPKIIAEEYLDNKDGDLWDYKFWCFDGKVKLVQIDRNRFGAHAKRFYTTDWQPLEYGMKGHLMDEILERPKMLDEMIAIAEKLSEDFIHVRVDLYCVDDKIYFGEMTFSHESGITKWTSDQIDEEIGKFIKLPIDKQFELSCMYKLPERLQCYERIFIYGAGRIGKFMRIYLDEIGLTGKFETFLVTSKITDEIEGKKVILIDKANINDSDIVIIAANKKNRVEMVSTCQKNRIKNIIEIDFFDGLTPYENVPKSEYPLFMKCWYKLHTSYNLNLENPTTFNDKINWLKIHDVREIRSTIVDKYTAKKYITDKLGAEYVIPLLGVYDTFDQINFDELPDQFVLKCNTGSDWNAIVKDKSKFDIQSAKKKFDIWIKKNPAYINFLPTFENVPLKIIAEEYVENEDGDLWDYKFWCFHGEVKYVQMDRKRFIAHVQRFYTPDWQPLDFVVEDHKVDQEILNKPPMLEKMIEVSEKLSAEFPFVRVDLYCVKDKIYFGEMTFCPLGGIAKWNPNQMNYEVGALLDLKRLINEK